MGEPIAARPISPEADSFRDPDGSAFYRDGRVLRGLSPAAVASRDRVVVSEFFPRLLVSGLVLGTRPCGGEAPPSWRGVLWVPQ